MKASKIIIVLILVLSTLAAQGMNLNFFQRCESEIQKEIDKTLENESLNEGKKKMALSNLYEEMCVVLESNGASPAKIMASKEASIGHKKAAEEIRNKEILIKQIEAKIERILNSPDRERKDLIALIPDYEALNKLNPRNTDYQKNLNKLQKFKLRIELTQLVRELEEGGDKKGLVKAYSSIMNTYKNEEKNEATRESYRVTIAALQQEIAQEEAAEHAQIQEALKRVEAERLAEEKAVQEATERLEQEQLRAAELAMHRFHYQKLSDNITMASTFKDKNFTELKRKMLLASLLKQRAQLAQGAEADAAQAQYDLRKSSEYGYAALALAKTKAEKDAAHQLLLTL